MKLNNMNKFTTRRSTTVIHENNYIVCSPSGIIDYYGRVSKKLAENIAEKANKIAEILPNIDTQKIIDLVVLDETSNYE